MRQKKQELIASKRFSFFRDTARLSFFVLSIVANLSLWAMVYWGVGSGEEMVVIRYNAYFGIDLTGFAWQAFLLPFLALLFFGVHGAFSVFSFRSGESFLALLFLLSAFLIQVATAIAVLALVLVN